jgi:hypothetical protein
VWLLARLRNQRVFKSDITTSVSIVLACHNEAANMKARIKNLLEPEKVMIANFADRRVGAVSGELLLDASDNASVGEGVGLYWKYEKWIRKSESRFGSVIGATGAIYAIRREVWKPLPLLTILDDVYTPMLIALGGRRVVRPRFFMTRASRRKSLFMRACWQEATSSSASLKRGS